MTASYLSVGPVSRALYAIFQDAAFVALCPGGVTDSLPQDPTYPCLLFTVSEGKQLGGLGTKPGRAGALPEVVIRLQVLTQYGGETQAQTVMAAAIALVTADNAFTVEGYTVCGIDAYLDDTTGSRMRRSPA
jgi:hypothetical protein